MGSSGVAPLLVRMSLTREQRRQIRDQTGHSISALVYRSHARAVRCRFGGIAVRVTRGVFAPTSATERLLGVAISEAKVRRRPVIIDVGTGSGALALAVAMALPRATLYGTDVSTIALDCARRNRARLGLKNVLFRRGSLLSPLPLRLCGRVGVIVANVPYVPRRLREELRGWFPEHTAIGTGMDGLGLVRDLAAAAREFLMPGGSLLLQLAGSQWADFSTELAALGYAGLTLHGRPEDGPVAGRMTWPG